MRTEYKVYAIIMSLLILTLIVSCSEDSTTQPVTNPEVPQVNILSPSDNSSVGGLVNIVVSATDNKGVVKVEIYIDNQTNNLRTLLVEPYEYLWDASSEPNGSKHTIFAKAYDGDDNISSSKVITVTKVTVEPPAEFSGSIKGDSAVVFVWSIENPNNYTFVIQESINNGQYQEIFETPSGALTCTIEKAYYKNITYKYRVSSKKEGILSSPSPNQTVYVLFPRPTNLIANKNNASSVTLSWNDNSDFEEGFVVEKSEDGGSIIQIANLPANLESYTDNSFNENLNNIYYVSAVSKYNKSDSATVSILTGGPTISNSVVDPDTIVVSSPTVIFTSVDAMDPNGLGDIAEVYFIVYRPDGTTNGNKVFLYDDGKPEYGDVTAGDGTFSRLIQVDQSNQKGTYRFEFLAEDRQGSLSNIINHYFLLL